MAAVAEDGHGAAAVNGTGGIKDGVDGAKEKRIVAEEDKLAALPRGAIHKQTGRHDHAIANEQFSFVTLGVYYNAIRLYSIYAA